MHFETPALSYDCAGSACKLCPRPAASLTQVLPGSPGAFTRFPTKSTGLWLDGPPKGSQVKSRSICSASVMFHCLRSERGSLVPRIQGTSWQRRQILSQDGISDADGTSKYGGNTQTRWGRTYCVFKIMAHTQFFPSNAGWSLPCLKSLNVRTGLVVRQLRLCIPNAGGLWSVPGWGTESLCAPHTTKNDFGKESKCRDHGWRVVFNAGLIFWAGGCCLGVCVEKDSEAVSGLSLSWMPRVEEGAHAVQECPS